MLGTILGAASKIIPFAGKAISALGGLEGIGKAASGAGQLINAVNRPPGPGKANYKSIMGQARAAKELGLHPLAVIGKGGGGYTTAMNGSILGDSLETVGAVAQDAAPNKLAAKRAELMDAQIAEARSRTLLNAANARRTLGGPRPAVTGVAGGLEAMDKAPGGRRRGVEIRAEANVPSRQSVAIGDKSYPGPNPEAFEIGVSELLAGGAIYGSQWMWDQLPELRRPPTRRNSRGRVVHGPLGPGR